MAPIGFFRGKTKSELAAPIRATGCASCGLSIGCLHPKMEPSGDGKEGILILAEGPGETEDRTGTQLVGKVGQRLRRTLKELGIDLDRDCRKTNSVRCRPIEDGSNRAPTNDEIAACRYHVFDEIRAFRPKVIILLGAAAVYSLLQGRWKHDSDFSIGRWRGVAIPDHELGAWVCPTYHPSYIVRSDSYAPAADVIWRRDLERALALAKVPLPTKLEPKINILEGSAVREYLLSLWKRSKSGEMLTIAWDYEADGLKPYRSNFKIYSCSIAERPEEAFAWSMLGLEGKTVALFRSIMEREEIRKIAGNIKYEQVVTKAKLGFEVKGWHWDVVNVGHIMDNRAGNSNVKFQSFTRLGVMDYDSHIRKFLRTPDPNGVNQIHKIPTKELLEYNGLDSCYEYGIYLNQREELSYG